MADRCRGRVCALLLTLLACDAGAASLTLRPEGFEVGADFTGARLSVTGAVDRGSGLVLEVAGPEADVRLARKARRGPVWINADYVLVRGAPSLHYLYSSAPIESLLTPAARARARIRSLGAEGQLQPRPAPDEEAPWRAALVRLHTKSGLYRAVSDAPGVDAEGRYTLDIPLPASLPTGRYRVSAWGAAAGTVTSVSTAEFEVRFVGVEHWLWAVAHEHPWSFGSLFTLAAVALGLLLSAIVPRRA